MGKEEIVKQWLKIDYYYIANKIGFIEKQITIPHQLILKTIRLLDYETSMVHPIDIDTIITILALMWEHIDKEKYDIRDFAIKILSRIGYPTSSIIVDKEFDFKNGQFSGINSVFDKYTVTLLQSRNEVTIGENVFLLTSFQRHLWDTLESRPILGISAPTSAGKSFVILLNTIKKMLERKIDVIYIVPTLSLLNQVAEDYNELLQKTGIKNYLITNNLAIGESEAEHTIYIWTQEKAISALTADSFDGLPNETILVIDEVQNIERISEDKDVRAKILFDTIQELRYASNVKQIVIAGPRINHIAQLGENLFGKNTEEVVTSNSPVLNLTYSIYQDGPVYWFKQYCGLFNIPYSQKIEHPSIIAGYGSSTITSQYTDYLSTLVSKFHGEQNIIFAPTSSSARLIANALAVKCQPIDNHLIDELVKYYETTVNANYSLCETLKKGVAYHHGKLPVHVRRTLEKAIKTKLVSDIVCTTTLMQGVNMPAQNVIIRNPHLYTRRSGNTSELTSYDIANLRGRAGRLLKDFIGRTIMLDESEFAETDGYNQESLFEDAYKEVYTGYASRFDEYKDEILDSVTTDNFVNDTMSNYGYLVTYIRQTILRYGRNARKRMANAGVILSPQQVAAIKKKLEILVVPKSICLHNRYWDPFVLNDIYINFKGDVPNLPTDSGAKYRLSELLKFLRDNGATNEMYQRYIPPAYRNGKNRGLLCAMCIDWAGEKPLHEILSGSYFTGDNASEHIENTIKTLQDTISFNVPLLIKPIVEMSNVNSSIVTCLQAGANNPYTRKMIEIGIPRELAIHLNKIVFSQLSKCENMNSYDFDLFVRDQVRKAMPKLSYWERVQLEFLKG